MRVNMTQLSKIQGVVMNTVRAWLKEPDFPVVQMADKQNSVKWEFDVTDVLNWRLAKERKSAGDKAKYLKLRNEKLAEEVRRLEIDNAKAESEVVYIEDARAYLRDCFVRVRQSLRTVPAKVSPLVVLETEVPLVKDIILKEIDHCLTVLSQPKIENSQILMEGVDED